MKKRYVAGAVAGGIVALWCAKMSMKMTRDLRRYNHLRSLSDEGPVQEEMPDMLLQLMTQERHFLMAIKSFFHSVPHDVQRDAKIFTM